MAATTPNHFVSAMLVFGLLAIISLDFTVAEMGVCYGRNGNNLPSPHHVVDLYKRQNIGRMRIYDPDADILDALRGSGIHLILTITNRYLKWFTNCKNADRWVQYYVINFPDVNFNYISVGNEINPADGTDTSHYAQFVLPAMLNIYRAISRAGLADQIKISTTIGMAVVGNSYPPQEGAFRDDALPYLRPIVGFISETGAPLLVNIYPYFAYINNMEQIDLGYALLEPNHGIHVNGVYYDNLFCAMVDAVYAALGRIRINKQQDVADEKTKVVVTESNWPTKGHSSANTRNAERYVQNLIATVGEGTPTSSEPIETYIFAMFDENEKPGAESERNFGLFYPNGQPKYNFDFN